MITGETCDKPGAWLDSALRFLDASLKSFMKGNVQQASYIMMKNNDVNSKFGLFVTIVCVS